MDDMIARDLSAGRFTTDEDAAKRPGETTVETVKSKMTVEQYHRIGKALRDREYAQRAGDTVVFTSHADQFTRNGFSVYTQGIPLNEREQETIRNILRDALHNHTLELDKFLDDSGIAL